MDKKENFAFDAYELKSIATYHLNGNEYRLFDFITYKCRINDNWWEYTDKQWEEVTGMLHNTYRDAKTGLEKKGFIINLNQGQHQKNQDGTINNKRNRLSVNVDYILSLKKEREKNNKYNYKSNLTKISKIDTMVETTKMSKIDTMVNNEETKISKFDNTRVSKFEETRISKFDTDNNKSIKQEKKKDIIKESNISITTSSNDCITTSSQELSGITSNDFNKLDFSFFDCLLDRLSNTRLRQDYVEIDAEMRSYNKSGLTQEEINQLNQRYSTIKVTKMKEFEEIDKGVAIRTVDDYISSIVGCTVDMYDVYEKYCKALYSFVDSSEYKEALYTHIHQRIKTNIEMDDDWFENTYTLYNPSYVAPTKKAMVFTSDTSKIKSKEEPKQELPLATDEEVIKYVEDIVTGSTPSSFGMDTIRIQDYLTKHYITVTASKAIKKATKGWGKKFGGGKQEVSFRQYNIERAISCMMTK